MLQVQLCCNGLELMSHSFVKILSVVKLGPPGSKLCATEVPCKTDLTFSCSLISERFITKSGSAYVIFDMAEVFFLWQITFLMHYHLSRHILSRFCMSGKCVNHFTMVPHAVFYNKKINKKNRELSSWNFAPGSELCQPSGFQPRVRSCIKQSLLALWYFQYFHVRV